MRTMVGIVAATLLLAGCGADAPADGAATALAPSAQAADAADANADAQPADVEAAADDAAPAAGGDEAPVDAAQAAMAARAVKLVGLDVPPYPEGLEELSGTCVSPSTDPAQVCSHGIGVLGQPSTDPSRSAMPVYVVASRSLGRDGQKARWAITDALPHPVAEEGAWLQAGSCAIGGKDDARVVALVAQDGEAERLPASWARRLDFDSGRFAVVDPATVDCVNEAQGL